MVRKFFWFCFISLLFCVILFNELKKIEYRLREGLFLDEESANFGLSDMAE